MRHAHRRVTLRHGIRPAPGPDRHLEGIEGQLGIQGGRNAPAHNVVTEGIEEFFGSPMYWSHYDAEINLRMIDEIGFHTLRSENLPDGSNTETVAHHLFLLAEKRVVGTQVILEDNH